ncbi:hypothetical protein TRM7557_02131 [Tritonibacter multivorans]|uniref:Uncharacterized protein n=1 Tax=Tritonibacter multivorans TaxID=928856 RepID=A0A0P1GBV8_9RHOB|nr:hypothetical protein [Tritonibacter multivorans]MDA7421343.1 hypothetical protein [Tritonibacter multivorans]CUH78968.1 hypothetical protein TRM7557_02131 [Tritonibacter multivorans]SFD26934.1 hypothetical protein SAMN04488049_11054 [Tritonibacter multivorans]
MSTFVPKSVQEALDRARFQEQQRRNRLRVHAGAEIFPVLRRWEGGFAMAGEDAPQLRGLVDLYEGSRHIFQCLIVASEEEAGEMRYEFKRATPASDEAPLDFYRAPDAPIGLLPG